MPQDKDLGVETPNRNEHFGKELTSLLNRYSWDSKCGTPDYILAESVQRYLLTLSITIESRENWFGRPLNTIGDIGGTLNPAN